MTQFNHQFRPVQDNPARRRHIYGRLQPMESGQQKPSIWNRLFKRGRV